MKGRRITVPEAASKQGEGQTDDDSLHPGPSQSSFQIAQKEKQPDAGKHQQYTRKAPVNQYRSRIMPADVSRTGGNNQVIDAQRPCQSRYNEQDGADERAAVCNFNFH